MSRLAASCFFITSAAASARMPASTGSRGRLPNQYPAMNAAGEAQAQPSSAEAAATASHSLRFDAGDASGTVADMGQISVVSLPLGRADDGSQKVDPENTQDYYAISQQAHPCEKVIASALRDQSNDTQASAHET
jgi:hypothetical protein